MSVKKPKRHTSTARYNIILAGAQLVLKEAGESLNSIRRQSKGRNFSPAERDIRWQIRLAKEAIALTEEELDRHLSVYDQAQSFDVSHPIALPDGRCPDCDNPFCKGSCDAKNSDSKKKKEESK